MNVCKEDEAKRPTNSKKIKDGTSCFLAIGSKENIVGAETIFDFEVDVENVKVSIDVVIDGDCSILVPTKKGANILLQEIDSHLLWLRHLVIIDKEKIMCIQFMVLYVLVYVIYTV